MFAVRSMSIGSTRRLASLVRQSSLPGTRPFHSTTSPLNWPPRGLSATDRSLLHESQTGEESQASTTSLLPSGQSQSLTATSPLQNLQADLLKQSRAMSTAASNSNASGSATQPTPATGGSWLERIAQWLTPTPAPVASSTTRVPPIGQVPTKEGEFASLTTGHIPELLQKLQKGEIVFRGVNAANAHETPLANAHRDKSAKEIAQLPLNEIVTTYEAKQHAENQPHDSKLLSLTTNVGMANGIANPKNAQGYVDPKDGVVQVIDRRELRHNIGDAAQSELVVKHRVERSRVLGIMNHKVAAALEQAGKETPEAQSRLAAMEKMKKENQRRNSF